MKTVYVLDLDPRLAAAYHCDRHICMYIMKYGQILSHAHIALDACKDFKLATINESTDTIWGRWILESVENYNWLYKLWLGLCDEYRIRFNKVNANELRVSEFLLNPPKNISQIKMTKFPIENPVETSRNIYLNEKFKIVKYRHSESPPWFVVT